jgi:hypothetical protein
MMQRWELPAFGRDNLVLTSALRPKPDPKGRSREFDADTALDGAIGPAHDRHGTGL